MASGKKKVLFMCLGNICRSPIAEAILQHMVEQEGIADNWELDSAAVGTWHIGNPPDERTLRCLKRHGVSTSHRARQLTKKDFTTFDIIFGMDDENMEDLDSMKPNNCTAELKLLGEYDPQGERIIQDPYYGEEEGFERAFIQCERCCRAFLDQNK